MARAKKKATTKARVGEKARVSDKARDTKIKQFRSQLLEKIRSDVAMKRAALQAVQKAGVTELGSMGYWKKAYWKMPYWKAGGHMMGIEEIINPAIGAVSARKLQAKRKKTR